MIDKSFLRPLQSNFAFKFGSLPEHCLILEDGHVHKKLDTACQSAVLFMYISRCGWELCGDCHERPVLMVFVK